MLVETNIFRPNDAMIPGWEKFSTSGQRMPLFLGKFQIFGQRIDIYIPEPGSFLLKWLISTLVETIILRPEDSMLPWLEEFLNFRSENAIPLWKVSTFHPENSN